MKKLIFIVSLFLIAISCECQVPSIGGMRFSQGTTTPTGPDCIEYGLLYNYLAAAGDTTGDRVTDSPLSSSDDWTLPTRIQVINMYTYLGGNTVAGGKLKDSTLTFWDSPNTGATDEYGFNGRGGGQRGGASGTYSDINFKGNYWTSTPYFTAGQYFFILAYNNDDVILAGNNNWAITGLSVKLVKTATGVADGVTTTYTGNDGQEYTAVAINQVYWLIQPLKETKLRDGTIIPFHGADNANNFTNAEWHALTTFAVCAYDNDLNNVGCAFSFPTE